MTQKQRCAGLQIEGSIFSRFVQALSAEWIGGEKSVGADVPRCGKTETAWVIQNSHTDVFPSDRAMVVAPLGTFPPRIGIGQALAADDVTGSGFILFNLDRHLRGDADAESCVFFVFHFDGFTRRLECLVHIDYAGR